MDRVEEFFDACIEAKEVSLGDVIYDLNDELGWGPHLDYNRFVDAARAAMRVRELEMTAKRKRLLRTALTERDEGAMPVVKRVHRGHVPAE